MARPQRPTDLLVTNGWYLDIPGLVSPHFETLDGLQIVSNKVEIVDAGSNKKYKFGSQIIDFGDFTLTRTYQNSPDDAAWERIVNLMIRQGLAYDVPLIKLHHGVEAFRMLLEGFNVHATNFPTFDVNAEEKFLVSYSGTCNDVRIVR